MARSKPSKTSRDEEVLQGLAVALGEGGDDHLVGGLGALDEAARIEARLDAWRSRRGRARDRRARLGDALPALGRGSAVAAGAAPFAGARQPHDVVAAPARGAGPAAAAARGGTTDRSGGCSLPVFWPSTERSRQITNTASARKIRVVMSKESCIVDPVCRLVRRFASGPGESKPNARSQGAGARPHMGLAGS